MQRGSIYKYVLAYKSIYFSQKLVREVQLGCPFCTEESETEGSEASKRRSLGFCPGILAPELMFIVAVLFYFILFCILFCFF